MECRPASVFAIVIRLIRLLTSLAKRNRISPLVTLLVGSVLLVSCGPGSPFDQTGTNVDYELTTGEVEEILTYSLHGSDDANGDGKVTLDEWKAANPTKKSSEFRKRDSNGNGIVTIGEFETYVARNGTFDKVLHELDADGDGVVSNTDFDRFRKRHKLLD